MLTLRRSAGFTVLEIVVTLAILALLAGVVAPQVIGRMAQGEAAALSSSMATIRDAVLEFRGDVGRYPSNMAYLQSQPGSPVDLCGNSITTGQIGFWRGPYVTQNIPAGGIPVGTAIISNTLVRSPTGYSATGTLFIQVSGVDRAAAEDMESTFDGNSNFAAGVIRWTANDGPNRGLLSFGVPIAGC